MKTVLVLTIFAGSLLAQPSKTDDGEDFVIVQKKYVSEYGLAHATEATGSKWIGIGKEVGIATREGLNSVVDVSERFGATNVGRFVMFAVAWRVFGKQVIAFVIGIPLWLLGVAIWYRLLCRFMFGYHDIIIEDGKKVRKQMPPYKFTGSDSRGVTGAVFAFFPVVWAGALFLMLFAS